MNEVRRWWAPGRVTLLGEHLDYNGGTALSVAIEAGVTVKARRRSDATVRLWSTAGRRVDLPPGLSPAEVEPWAVPAAGVVSALRDRGLDRGADVVVESDLPEGAGLSSSAAFCCGVATALAATADVDLDRAAVAATAARAEQADAPTGLLDQHAVSYAEPGRVTVVDCATEPPTVTTVPFGFEAVLLVIDVGESRRLGDGRYAERRGACERAARAAGLDRLAEIGLDALVRLDDESLKARARHVLTEGARVRSALRVLREGTAAELGALMVASHSSLRDDFEVSTARLDVAVETAVEHGAHGAKLSGAGFGGSVVALLDADRLTAVRAAVTDAFERAGWRPPRMMTTRPAGALGEIA